MSLPPQRRRTWMPGLLAILLAAPLLLAAQITTDRQEGLRDNTPRFHALTGARVVLAPGQVIENGTVIVRDGIIIASGDTAVVPLPEGARVWYLQGRTIYAGFIDLASAAGVPAALRPAPSAPAGGLTGGASAVRAALVGRAITSKNPRVHPEQDLAQLLEFKADDIKQVRELGFTSVLATPRTGVFRGQSALVNMQDDKPARSMVVVARAASHVANEFSRGWPGTHPNSLMGSVALVRQTLFDARWYRDANLAAAKNASERPETNASLDALLPALSARQPVFYVAEDEQAYARIASLGKEFDMKLVIEGNGHEYRRAGALEASRLPVVVPLNFPPPPEVENPDSARDSALEVLDHWEQAPSNLAQINKAGVEFAVTAQGLKEMKKDFWPHLREAVKRGLPAEKALAALTTVPAKILGEDARLGSLSVGRMANIVVAQGDLFRDEKSVIELTFVDGQPYPTSAWERFELRGTWEIPGARITSSGTNTVWQIGGTATRPLLKLNSVNCALTLRGTQLVVRLPCVADDPAGAKATDVIVAEGRNNTLRGSLQRADGSVQPWVASRTQAFVAPAAVSKPEPPVPPARAHYPAGAFGVVKAAAPAIVLVKNATVWTSAAAGRLDRADMLVRNGKIAALGENLAVPSGAMVIDATGRHLSPGIIDAHSHTAIIGSVNESTSSVTSEVRVADALDATDINIYRQLAGGVTTANLLHGSANTIGGQNQVIKLRWGEDAEALKFAGAIPGIKFALGENVKQASRGAQADPRYPQTRLGVEQVLRDAFAAANAYRSTNERWQKSARSEAPPRRDLQLDALLEIFDGKRVIHIHSYRADEILMFVRLSQELGFTVATFQHVLEGYKVADAIAAIGAGGSTFSDWWGYKMEVIDAIPHNAAIMRAAGVVTSFNSDSNELARRLNVEAAKAVKYGGLSEAEAFKLVTINPAKQLRVDNRTGSLEVGKDADFVIWSGNPLSTFSRVEQTWIDGRRYFELEADKALRADAAVERTRLIAKALPARLALLNAAGAPPAAEAADKKPNEVSEMLHFLALQRWLHQQAKYRNTYWAGSENHECTEDMR